MKMAINAENNQSAIEEKQKSENKWRRRREMLAKCQW